MKGKCFLQKLFLVFFLNLRVWSRTEYSYELKFKQSYRLFSVKQVLLHRQVWKLVYEGINGGQKCLSFILCFSSNSLIPKKLKKGESASVALKRNEKLNLASRVFLLLEVMETFGEEQQGERSAHPTALFFCVAFKISALIVYLLCSW